MCPSLKRQSMAVAVVLAALVLMVGNAWAQARKTVVSCSANSATGDVTADYQIKGVGDENLCVVTSTTFTARCACRNNGGNCPSDVNKQALDIEVAEGDVAEPRNGQISTTAFGGDSASQVLAAPTDADCADALDCPGGQTAILAEAVVGVVTVTVFDDFDLADTTSCTGNPPAIRGPISCTPSPTVVTFDPDCAALFD